MMAKQFDYEVKTTIRLNMHNPDHVLINNVIQNLDPKIFKSKNQFILDACKFYIDNYGSETFIAKKKIMKGLNISGQQILRTLKQRL